jgi:predicted ATPase
MTILIDPFIGRARELSDLSYTLDKAMAGHGGVFLLTGEAGIGKTRLIREFSSEVVSRSVPYAWASCDELRRSTPLSPWIDLASELEDVLQTSQAAVSTGPDHQRLISNHDISHIAVEQQLSIDAVTARPRTVSSSTRYYSLLLSEKVRLELALDLHPQLPQLRPEQIASIGNYGDCLMMKPKKWFTE